MEFIIKLLMFPVFHLILKPLIQRNYYLRKIGVVPDEWYWADTLAVKYKYFVGDPWWRLR